jgi:hypothetical protein
MRFGDLLTAVDDAPVAHPQQVIETIGAARPKSTLRVAYVRDGVPASAELAVSRRAQDVREVSIPLLYSYEKERGISETSILLGAFVEKSTAAAWEVRLLWLFTFSGGDADRLVEVER